MSSNDWVYLNIGDKVSIQRTNDHYRTGYVDAINDEANIFWVQLDEGRGRVLVYEGDGSQVQKTEDDYQGDSANQHR